MEMDACVLLGGRNGEPGVRVGVGRATGPGGLFVSAHILLRGKELRLDRRAGRERARKLWHGMNHLHPAEPIRPPLIDLLLSMLLIMIHFWAESISIGMGNCLTGALCALMNVDGR